jgi:hypothetical protein
MRRTRFRVDIHSSCAVANQRFLHFSQPHPESLRPRNACEPQASVFGLGSDTRLAVARNDCASPFPALIVRVKETAPEKCYGMLRWAQ